MIKFEDDCVCCDIPCINCGRRETPYYYCDKCGEECQPNEMYEYEDMQLCVDCLLKEVPTIV